MARDEEEEEEYRDTEGEDYDSSPTVNEDHKRRRDKMDAQDLLTEFAERPEYLLALVLSTPNVETPTRLSAVTVEFGEAEVVARVRRPSQEGRGPQLLATKQTIFAAILLHHLILARGPEFASSVEERARYFAEKAAVRNADFSPNLQGGWYPPSHSPDADSSTFFQDLDITPADLDVAQDKTNEALAFLEQQGLAIDPAFTPEFMVLAGLVPMHFSVRTPKGERVYREIKVNAPLWSLDIVRGTRNAQRYTDIEFKFRGIEIVRKAITAMATQYLESEEKVRHAKGQPTIRRKGPPSLDREGEG